MNGSRILRCVFDSRDSIGNFLQNYVPEKPSLKLSVHTAKKKAHAPYIAQQPACQFDLEPNADDIRLLNPDCHADFVFTKVS